MSNGFRHGALAALQHVRPAIVAARITILLAISGCTVNVGSSPPPAPGPRSGELVCGLSWSEFLSRELQTPVTTLSGDWFSESSHEKHFEMQIQSTESNIDGVTLGGMKVSETPPSGQESRVFEVYARKTDAETMEILVRSTTEFRITIDDNHGADLRIIDIATGNRVQGAPLAPGEYALRAEVASKKE